MDHGRDGIDIRPRTFRHRRIVDILLERREVGFEDDGFVIGRLGDDSSCQAEIDEQGAVIPPQQDGVGRDVARVDIGPVERCQRVKQRCEKSLEPHFARRGRSTERVSRMRPSCGGTAIYAVPYCSQKSRTLTNAGSARAESVLASLRKAFIPSRNYCW